MIPHGRGRGIYRVQDNDRPVGMVKSNQEVRGQDDPRFRDGDEVRGRGGEDSPIPPSFSTSDLLQLLEEGKEWRRITRGIKHLCSSEQALRWGVDTYLITDNQCTDKS